MKEIDILPILERIDRRLEMIASTGPRFIARSYIIKEIGRANYEYGVEIGALKEIKGPARNSRTLIDRLEYENFLIMLQK